MENQKSKRASGKTRLGSLLRTRIPIHFYLVFTRSPVRLWICQPTGAKLLRTVIPYCRVSHQRWRSTAHGAQITRCRFFRAHAIIELALTTATELPPMPLRKLFFADEAAPVIELLVAEWCAKRLVMIVGRDSELGSALLIAAARTDLLHQISHGGIERAPQGRSANQFRLCETQLLLARRSCRASPAGCLRAEKA